MSDLPPIPTIPIRSSDPDARIPVLGFGVGTAWYKRSGESAFSQETADAISQALNIGFHHIDGAEVYSTEPEIGAALSKTTIPRSDLFIVTKLHNSIDNIQEGFNASLQKLGVDYVDLYILHQPYFRHEAGGAEKFQRVWREIEAIYDSGRAKSIGVSNFELEDLEELLKFARIKPTYNQIELHPQLPPSPALLSFSASHNILTSAYGPLTPLLSKRQDASLPVPKVAKTAEELAKKYNKTPGQILLRWVLDQGVVAITTSAKEERLREYRGAVGWTLEKEDHERISRDGAGEKRRAFWRQIGWLRERDEKEGIA